MTVLPTCENLSASMIHSIATLRYRLVSGEADLTPLQILETDTILWNGWRVSFFILGASHAVRLESGSACITELLTCAPPGTQDPASRPHLDLPADLPNQACVTVTGLDCRVRLSVFPLSGDCGPNIDRPVGSFEPHGRLSHIYPDPSGAALPLTWIAWRVEPGRLWIETIHTYPEEEQGVRSETLFELPEATPFLIQEEDLSV